MPKVSPQYSESQRSAILAGATRCFAKKGFHRATMRDVLRETGISAGALYLYFKSKDELIEAIARNRHRRERQWMTDSLEDAALKDGLRRLVRRFGAALMDRNERQERRLSIQLWAEALSDQAIKKSVTAGIHEPIRLLTGLLKAGQRRGEFPLSLDCEAAARAVVALFQGFILQQAWEPGVSVEGYIEVVESMLVALSDSSKRENAR